MSRHGPGPTLRTAPLSASSSAASLRSIPQQLMQPTQQQPQPAHRHLASHGKDATEAEREAERDRNRKLLAEVSSSHVALTAQFKELRDTVQLNSETVQRNSSQFDAIKQELNNAFSQLRQDMQLMQAQLAELVGLKERINLMAGDVQQVKDTAMQAENQARQGGREIQSLKQSVLTKQDQQRLQSQADQMAEELGKIKHGVPTREEQMKLKHQADHLSQELHIVKSTTLPKEELAKLKTQAEHMAQELSKMRTGTLSREEHSKLKRQADAMREELEKLKSSTNRRDELDKIVQELDKLKSGTHRREELNRIHEELCRLKSDVRPQDSFATLQLQADNTALAFNDLKKQIYDRGLLAPRPEVVSKESPAVGTLELHPNVFTARLLLRLGILKGYVESWGEDTDSVDGHLSGEETSASNSMQASRTLSRTSSFESPYVAIAEACMQFKNVSGINVPDVEPGEPGYCKVTVGWMLVCMFTLFVQLLILYVMTRTYASLEHCLTATPYVDMDWWLIHVSRMLAMFVSGSIMTKDFMDIVNYWMVSLLLEPTCSLEVAVTALLRILLRVGLAVAHIVLFMSYTDPGFLWVNMAALDLVASLGQDMLEIAKRGVLGHDICKAVTGLSFTLTLVHEYPRWFLYVRDLTLSTCIVGVTILAIALFMMQDPPCEEASNWAS